jgi:twitching motility protein PilT
VHQNKESIFSQREVGEHTSSFSGAIRGAIRQNPDVILVGELRDAETIGLALTAAEMGALVFATLHTNSAPKTIDRIIDAFPAEEQEQARTSLAETLVGVVAQLLLKRSDKPGRCACTEILLKTTALPNIIREGATSQIMSLMQAGKALGMRTMDDSLAELVTQGKVSARNAYLKATDKPSFEAMLPKEDA